MGRLVGVLAELVALARVLVEVRALASRRADAAGAPVAPAAGDHGGANGALAPAVAPGPAEGAGPGGPWVSPRANPPEITGP